MARTAKNSHVESRTARSKLSSRREPYWTTLGEGCHVGYRRTAKGAGTWIGKFRDESGVRRYESLGAADDIRDADGLTALSFRQAQERARGWFEKKAREFAGETVQMEPYAVADAMRDYLAWYKAHRKASGHSSTRTSVATHILPTFGTLPIAKLTTAKIRKWHEDLASAPPMLRTPLGRQRRYREVGSDPETLRRRKSTANRLLTILRAALNKAFADGKVASDEAWRRVKPFRDVDSARLRYHTDDECRRLVNACDADFRPLVQAALLTGCRYGELVALRTADFNADVATLRVPQSKSGKARNVVLTDEGYAFFARQAAGKAGEALLLPRHDGRPWGKSHQQRPLVQACERARIAPAVSFHILRHSHASRLAMNGVPLAVVATQLGHADGRMVERHYAHLCPNYVAHTIRAGFGELGITATDAVTSIRATRR